MRKFLLVGVVLFVAVQAFAGVTLTVTDKGGGWARIGYSGSGTDSCNVSGFGLKITADSGAVFTGDINDYNKGESNVAPMTQPGYGIFPGTIVINSSNGTVTDYNTPVCPNTAPGASGSGPNTNTLVTEFGALFKGEPNRPPKSGTLISVKISKACNVCVAGEPVRGNVVVVDGNGTIESLSPAQACASIAGGCLPMTKAPYNPSPSDGAKCVALNSTISWSGDGNAVKYDVYFGTDNPPATKVSSDQTSTSWDPCGASNMPVYTVYHWKIVEKNSCGDPCAGPVWCFSTGATGTKPCCQNETNYRCLGDVNSTKPYYPPGNNYVQTADVSKLVTVVSNLPNNTCTTSKDLKTCPPCYDINGNGYVQTSDVSALVTLVSKLPNNTHKCPYPDCNSLP